MDRRQRHRVVSVLGASIPFYAGLIAVIAFAPSARVPVLLAVIVVLPLQSIVTAVVRFRRRRECSN
jgi:hypothetical protein